LYHLLIELVTGLLCLPQDLFGRLLPGQHSLLLSTPLRLRRRDLRGIALRKRDRGKKCEAN
jgi:hypothetical protein